MIDQTPTAVQPDEQEDDSEIQEMDMHNPLETFFVTEDMTRRVFAYLVECFKKRRFEIPKDEIAKACEMQRLHVDIAWNMIQDVLSNHIELLRPEISAYNRYCRSNRMSKYIIPLPHRHN
jgi:hypothetical protein